MVIKKEETMKETRSRLPRRILKEEITKFKDDCKVGEYTVNIETLIDFLCKKYHIFRKMDFEDLAVAMIFSQTEVCDACSSNDRNYNDTDLEEFESSLSDEFDNTGRFTDKVDEVFMDAIDSYAAEYELQEEPEDEEVLEENEKTNEEES